MEWYMDGFGAFWRPLEETKKAPNVLVLLQTFPLNFYQDSARVPLCCTQTRARCRSETEADLRRPWTDHSWRTDERR